MAEKDLKDYLISNNFEKKEDYKKPLSNVGILLSNSKNRNNRIINNLMNYFEKKNDVFIFKYKNEFYKHVRYEIFFFDFFEKLNRYFISFFEKNNEEDFWFIFKKVLEFKYEHDFFKDMVLGFLKNIEKKIYFFDNDVYSKIDIDIVDELIDDIEDTVNIFGEIEKICSVLNPENKKEFFFDFLLEIGNIIEKENRNINLNEIIGLEALDIVFEGLNFLNGTSFINFQIKEENEIIKEKKNKDFQENISLEEKEELRNEFSEEKKSKKKVKKIKTKNVILILQNFNLQNSFEIDQRYMNFYEHLILRFYTNMNQRSHFPLLIESTDSRYYNFDFLYNLRMNEFDIPIFDYSHLEHSKIKNSIDELQWKSYKILYLYIISLYSTGNLKKICDLILKENKKIEANQEKKFYNIFQNLKKNEKSQNLDQIDNNSEKEQKNITKFKEKIKIIFKIFKKKTNNNFIDLDQLIIKEEHLKRKEFLKKIENVNINPLCDELVDQHSLLFKFKKIDLLEKLLKWKNWGRLIFVNEYDFSILEDKVVRSFMEEKILFFNKYTNELFFFNSLYFVFAKEWVRHQKKNLSLIEKIHYFFWKNNSGIKIDKSFNIIWADDDINFHREDIYYETDIVEKDKTFLESSRSYREFLEEEIPKNYQEKNEKHKIVENQKIFD